MVDELALEFDDIAAAAEDMLRQQELSKEQYDCVLQLRELMDRISAAGDATLWSVEALTHRPEWDEVRGRAKACLRALEQSPSQ